MRKRGGSSTARRSTGPRAAGGSMFQNRMPRYEVLSAEAMATLDKGWRKLMTEIGVEFMDERALELFRKAGQRVEDHTVFLDPDFVLEQVAKAPREFDVQARNPANNIHIGGDSMRSEEHTSELQSLMR